MFCQKCGTEIEDTVAACPKCNEPVGKSPPIAVLSYSVKTTSKEAVDAFKTFATNPVGGLSVAYESLGESRAMGVGIAFGIVFVICFLFGGYLMIPAFMRDGLLRELGFGGFLKCLVVAVVPFLSIAAVSALIRKMFGGQGALGGDCFLAGSFLLPAAFFMLISGFIGIGNSEVIGLVGIFALCIGILMAFAGYTRIYKLTERTATFAVPIMAAASLWLMKIVYATLMKEYRIS